MRRSVRIECSAVPDAPLPCVYRVSAPSDTMSGCPDSASFEVAVVSGTYRLRIIHVSSSADQSPKVAYICSCIKCIKTSTYIYARCERLVKRMMQASGASCSHQALSQNSVRIGYIYVYGVNRGPTLDTRFLASSTLVIADAGLMNIYVMV